jgi:hypothetical protein
MTSRRSRTVSIAESSPSDELAEFDDPQATEQAARRPRWWPIGLGAANLTPLSAEQVALDALDDGNGVTVDVSRSSIRHGAGVTRGSRSTFVGSAVRRRR